ncbi:hypothetical protein MIMGU_mgv1a0234682mg, partial [Erythranthe guttata]
KIEGTNSTRQPTCPR